MSAFAFGLRFADWAQSDRRGGVTVQAIRSRFGVSRATAYRWQRYWLDEIARQKALTHGSARNHE